MFCKAAGASTRLATYARLRTNSIIVAGALTTTFGLIIGAGNVIPLLLKALNLPDCLTYSSVYRDPISYFKLEDGIWREYPPNGGTYRFEFRELHRTRDHIDLLNLTPRPDNSAWTNMVVRLPVCGGTAQISSGVPAHWTDLYTVWRD
jgi:hypothetical protein